jgi:UDP:flavonoid glycosyltransferase YjiC (YdhE family)
MAPHVAVAHYPEGAGHATRMLAVARSLEAHGATVAVAGGGPGTEFVDLHGYDGYEPATVDYIDDFQDGGNLLRVLTNSVPISAKRVLDYVGWLRREDPTALVTDDMFAAMAATLTGTPLHVLTHNAPGYYDERVEEWFTWLLTEYQLAAGSQFLYPAVWDEAPEDPDGVTRIPPVALEAPPDDAPVAADGGTPPTDPGVVLVPSHYSAGFEELAERLRAAGHRVTLVGGDDWETVPALLPVLKRAEAVVCSGYSTVMEAAVVGTPCVVYPFTDEQEGVARVLDRESVSGFVVVDDADGVAVALADPPEAVGQANGADAAAKRILAAH